MSNSVKDPVKEQPSPPNYSHGILAAAIEQAAETIVITGPSGAIQYVNPAFTSITGYSREEVMGQNPRVLKSGKQDERFYKELWDTVSSGKTWHGRFVNKRKDDSLYTEDAVISPVHDASGAILNYVAVKRDITNELSLEANLLQAQKMEAVGRLAGGVAHDFNNILSAIIGYCDLILKRLDKDNPIVADLRQIRLGGERAASLTRQLLAFSRRQILEPRLLNLNEAVRGLENMLRRLIGEDIFLLVSVAENSGSIMADPGQVEQVIMNLAVNARDAMQRGGSLTIETADMDLDESYASAHPGVTPGPHVMLAVTDTGAGMDEATRARIFEPFFTTKAKGKGTGLGLSTVYGIVKQSGGNIWVYSELGKGTTFKIFFPRAQDAAQEIGADKSSRPAALATGTETILAVEDETPLRGLVAQMLEVGGYKVMVAANGKEALDICRKHAGGIAMVMTDVVLPNMSGRELAVELRRLRPEIKVLFTSGYTDNSIVHHGVLDEGTPFIQKPYGVEALLAKVREVLDGRKGGRDAT